MISFHKPEFEWIPAWIIFRKSGFPVASSSLGSPLRLGLGTVIVRNRVVLMITRLPLTCVFLLILISSLRSSLAATPPLRSTHFTGVAQNVITYTHRSQFNATVPMTLEAWVYREDGAACET